MRRTQPAARGADSAPRDPALLIVAVATAAAVALAFGADGLWRHAGDRPGAVAALATLASGPDLAVGEWGAAAAAARKLALLGAADAARMVYRRLLAAPGLPEELKAQFQQEARR